MKNRFLIFLTNFLFAGIICAQNVSISPSRLYYKTAIGDYKVQEVTIMNNSMIDQSFTVSFGDFEPSGVQGKSNIMKPGESLNSCAQWLSADPSFFEIPAGQAKKIKVLMQVPASPEADKVKWAAMKVKLAREKNDSSSGTKESIGMGITETFQFVIHIFQSPPSVTLKNAEIESFAEITSSADTSQVVLLRVRNSGEAILDCVSYLELTNLGNGVEERQKPFAYTLLPGSIRELKFSIPSYLADGKYSVLGVVDYGSRDNVKAAETEVMVRKK